MTDFSKLNIQLAARDENGEVIPNTGYYAEIVADSVGPNGIRLTTFEVCIPRYLLAEWNTHKRFSRNSASSRAIPVSKQCERATNWPYIPPRFPKNRPGMQATEYIYPGDPEWDAEVADLLQDRDYAVKKALARDSRGLHKQYINRYLEPYMWHTIVNTATEYQNFFNLRDSELADPGFEIIANMMHKLYDSCSPVNIDPNEWHLPYVDYDDMYPPETNMPIKDLLDISAGRCAAVTLLNQKKREPVKDIARTRGNLIPNGHMSPMEHQAQCSSPLDLEILPAYRSNLDGWIQYRKLIPGEAIHRRD